MSYEKACEIAGLTTPKSYAENAKMATSKLANLAAGSPLKEKVACQVIIRAAQ